ncbi:MAG: YibE/F family protein [Lachnospiraceae bacterium]
MKIERKHLSMKWKLTGLLLIFAAVLIFVDQDAFLYEETVAKVISVENTFSHEEEGPNGETEKYYDQQIEARILNGDRKGDVVTLSNTYSSSGINDERYRKGNKLFLSVSGNSSKGNIIGKKRDIYLAILTGAFLILLFGLNGKKGSVIFCSLFINIMIFLVALHWYEGGKDLIRIAFFLVIVFNLITLIFAAGFHRKTAAAILSSLVTTMLCYGIYEVVLHTTQRLPYEMMDYVVNPTDLSDLFLTGVLMGSLGAVMDVSISIAAGVAELVKQKPDIQTKALIHSVREMGYDIMGTMINVLFFTYISSAIPVLVIKIKNGYTLYHLVHFQLIFEIIRFLMGAIGIVLAIPVSGFFSILMLHIVKKKAGTEPIRERRVEK